MAQDQNTCPLCQKVATSTRDDKRDALYYQCDKCGDFILSRDDLEDFLENEKKRLQCAAHKISSVLRERHLLLADVKHPSAPFLQFRERRKYPDIPGSNPIRVDEILADYPTTIPDRIHRSFCCLVRSGGSDFRAGQRIQFACKDGSAYLPFTLDVSEVPYFVTSLADYGWITKTKNTQPYTITITPQGWAKFHELSDKQGDVRNPVFVAMWFGKGETDRTAEMRTLFHNTIKPACEALGWRVKRADTDEHNEPIMDRVIADIRAAPFVIAELTENNQGVYYEAGFARGLGKEVIYCCPDGQRPHFDVTGVNQVKWNDAADLRKRLGDRILGTKGRGPHDFSDKRG